MLAMRPLQPSSGADMMPTRRQQIEDAIERLIALLDAMDGDADLEPESDLNANPVSLQAVDRKRVKHITRRAA